MGEKIAEILLFSFPEGIVIFYLALSFMAKKIKFIRIVAMGIIFGIAAYLIRETTGSFVLNIFCATILAILPFRLGRFGIWFINLVIQPCGYRCSQIFIYNRGGSRTFKDRLP